MRRSANAENHEAGKAVDEAVIMAGKDERTKQLANEIAKVK